MLKQNAQHLIQPKQPDQILNQTRLAKKLADSHAKRLENLAKGMPLLECNEVLELIISSVEVENEDALCAVHSLNEAETHLICRASSSASTALIASLSSLDIEDFPNSLAIAIRHGIGVIVEDILQHPDWSHYHKYAVQIGLGALSVEPIRTSSGTVIGAFSIFHRRTGSPGSEKLEQLRHATHLARIALERKSVQEELLLAASVYQNSSEAIMVIDKNDYIVAVNRAYSRITGYQEHEVIGKQQRHFKQCRPGGGASYRKIVQALETNGHWQGEIWSRRKNGEEFAVWLTLNGIRDENGDIYRRVCLFSDITKKKRSEELIWKQANYDSLTLLPNRRLFFDRLQVEISKSKRTGQMLVLMMLDLDGFKAVNDQLGHAIGDRLLAETASRIRECVRDSDTVARLGGDEFTLCIPQVSDVACIERIAHNINQTLARSIGIGDKFLRVSCSIGIAAYPRDADNMDDLLKHADQAMYVAKKLGRNRYNYFTPLIHEEALQRQYLINGLRCALDARQLDVHFQPIVDLATGRIIKAEALLRWTHPQMGAIGPDVFIPVAEEIGLICEIGDWVFQQAIYWKKRWDKLPGENIQISVNTSPAQFLDGNCYKVWNEILEENDLSATGIIIEITEGLLLRERREITERLARFRDQGGEIAIDDFGTGYSSLSYLRKFKVDYIKIDRSFIQDMVSDSSSLALSEAIIIMSHRLGLKVIAEGVETEAQRSLLADLDCDFGQGYLFSKPVPAEQMERLLATQ